MSYGTNIVKFDPIATFTGLAPYLVKAKDYFEGAQFHMYAYIKSRIWNSIFE